MSEIQRLDKFGLLSPKTIAAHCVQVSKEDISLMAKRGVSVSFNPVSNLKLHNGIAPAGDMLQAGVNVGLGTDGPNCSDEQSLFPVFRFAAALARLNGLGKVTDSIEDKVMELATSAGHRLWFPEGIAEDRVEYEQAVDPLRLTWTDAASSIKEVHVDGDPILARARAVVEERGAFDTVASLAARAQTPEAMDLGRRCEALLKRYAISK